MKTPPVHGLMAEFNTPEDFVSARGRAREEGYTRMDMYLAFPIDGLTEALGFPLTHLPLLVLFGGVLGGVGGFLMQYYAAGQSFQISVGGRLLNSWPAFIPVTSELTILFAGLTAVIAMLALNGLPKPNHPVFNVPKFERETRDGFFLCIESTDPKFEAVETRRFLETLQPIAVYNVEN